MLTTAAVEQILGQVRSEVDPFVSVVPWRHPQRHETWVATARSGRRVWLKHAQSHTPVAGVAHEAEVLARLAGRHRTPVLLASGDIPGEFLITAGIDGRSLSRTGPDSIEAALPSVATWLRRFAREADVSPYPAGAVADWDLFGARPDVRRLLSMDAAIAGFDTETRPQPSHRDAVCDVSLGTRAVHGSFDGDNILIDRQGQVIGVLDLEAARVGPVAIDVAALAVDLTLRGNFHLASRWTDLWLESAPNDSSEVANHLRLRFSYRHAASGLSAYIRADATKLISHVEHHSG